MAPKISKGKEKAVDLPEYAREWLLVKVDVHEDCQGALYLEAFVRKNLELVENKDPNTINKLGELRAMAIKEDELLKSRRPGA
ncbi:hypothetical protein NBRC10512_005945 [Rhodotorula toruloides]|uniref:RHTO0S02e01684g1_1 n=2 Tax=Rhodotorula toruloides TaxID=5286 RepID=A0A061AFQ2_RHOTO|nr:uncharacterized protein RHTO_01293 [Rhodotorula toruloides NP11]EMS22078.1 hypothetical protein RHTO_01293 [Rhodotorula toruloides NP11]KAJ8296232.1 hypothetical protein OF846_000633 [Rhodotorula toruloides]CDR36407.1 RHTO0S02e01684g1_1 [Rhodotorula toruloides]